METVKFEEEILVKPTVVEDKDSAMVRFIKKYSRGYVKTKKQADYLMLFFSGLIILFSVFLAYLSLFSAENKNTEELPAADLSPATEQQSNEQK